MLVVVNLAVINICSTGAFQKLTKRKTKIKLQMLLKSGEVKLGTELKLIIAGSLQYTVCPLGRSTRDRYQHGRVRCDLLQGRAEEKADD